MQNFHGNYYVSLFKRQLSFLAAAPAFVWQVLFFAVPLICIVGLSFLVISDSVITVTSTFYTFFLALPYVRIITQSLLLALANSIVCFIIGYPVAYFLAFRVGRLKNIFLFLLNLPFWTNMLLHIYAWLFVLDHSGLLNKLLLALGVIKQPLAMLYTVPAILIVMVYNYLLFMILPIYAVLSQFDRKLLEASFDLGATRWQTWRRVMLPLSMTGVQSGFFLVFVPSFGEFVVPALMGGDKRMFVGSVISSYVLGSQTRSLGAAFTVISSIALILFCLGLYSITSMYVNRVARE